MSIAEFVVAHFISTSVKVEDTWIMHDTLSSLIERALVGSPRPLEFYLREHSRLPGPRANLELAHDFGNILSTYSTRYSIDTERTAVGANTPAEFVLFCGLLASGICATHEAAWRERTIDILHEHACSSHWRIREAVTIALQQILSVDVQYMMPYLMRTATTGDYLQQRAVVTAIAEPGLLYENIVIEDALLLQKLVLERMHMVPIAQRKEENFRVLRRTLGYTLSVITAIAPNAGFALMRECISWNDDDITWVVRENLKKKRLAKYARDVATITKLLVR
jgi:hypothetical protein